MWDPLELELQAVVWASQCGCWELNLHSLEEQYTLLTAQPPLQQCSLLFTNEYKCSCHRFNSVPEADFSFFFPHVIVFWGIMIWRAEVVLCYWVNFMVITLWLEKCPVSLCSHCEVALAQHTTSRLAHKEQHTPVTEIKSSQSCSKTEGVFQPREQT